MQFCKSPNFYRISFLTTSALSSRSTFLLEIVTRLSAAAVVKRGVGGWISWIWCGGGGTKGVGGQKKNLAAAAVRGVGWSTFRQNRSGGRGKKDVGQCLGEGSFLNIIHLKLSRKLKIVFKFLNK